MMGGGRGVYIVRAWGLRGINEGRKLGIEKPFRIYKEFT